MATSYDGHGPDHVPGAAGPLRLTLAASLHAGPMSGAWWPRSRDLRWEATLLLEQFLAEQGRILRMLVSPDDWDGTPRHVPGPGGPVEVGLFPGDDQQVVVLGLASGVRLRLRVIDVGTETERAIEQMRAACAPRGGRSSTRPHPRPRVAGP